MAGGDGPDFGAVLKCYRLAARLTQEILAERAVMSARTIQAIERGENRPRKETVLRLITALELNERERVQALAAATPSPRRRAADVSTPVPTDEQGAPALRKSAAGSLPVGPLIFPQGDNGMRSPAHQHRRAAALSSLIGREEEQEQVCAFLRQDRLVTLTGAGGVGKTRLALAVAAAAVDDYQAGVWLVEFAALADAALVVWAVARALGVREESSRPILDAVTDHLQDRHFLLVLDNCEHLVPACAELVTALLQSCPHLHILATSREGLQVSGEQLYRVPSLSTPDLQRLPPPEFLGNYAAVRLFVARAQARHSGFALDARTGPAVAAICARLDGIPLAIELAAARVGSLPLVAIAERLDQSLHLLRGGPRDAPTRQQTLRATLDWSWNLLEAPERTLLRRLSVFAGGWPLEAAEVVCGDEGVAAGTVLDRLVSLVNKSVVVLDEENEPARRGGRYRMLEPVRQYALDQLEASGEATALRGQHLDWCLALAEDAAPRLEGPEQVAWLDRLEGELANLRVALGGAREAGEVGRGLRLARVLWLFWDRHGHRSEGVRWLQAFLALAPLPGGIASEEWTSARARALEAASWLAFMQTETGVARGLAEQSLTLFRTLEDPRGIASVLNTLGCLARDVGDFKRSVAMLEECLALSGRLGNSESSARTNLALTALQQGDVERAGSLGQEILVLTRDEGDPWEMACAIMVAGLVACEQGDLDRAQALAAQSLAIFRDAGDRRGIALILGFLLGPVAREQGDLARAVALGEESLALGRDLRNGGIIGWAALGHGLAAIEQGDLERAGTALRQALTLFWARGMQWFVARCLAGLAQVACKQEQAVGAVRLAGVTEALLARMDAPLPRGERAGYTHMVATARVVLGEEDFAAAWAEGQTAPLAGAIATALRDSAQPEGERPQR